MGDPSYANNFDRIQFDNIQNRWIIFEYSKCDPEQFERGITPWTSHPDRYWHKCANKFRLLWRLVQELNAIFYIVNYTDPDNQFGHQIRLIRVENVIADGIADENGKKRYVIGQTKEWHFGQFSDWFRKRNAAGR